MKHKGCNLDRGDAARRKLFKALLVGGGTVTTINSLPSTWTKPLIRSVVLPAHAAISPGPPSPPPEDPPPDCDIFNASCEVIECFGCIDATLYFLSADYVCAECNVGDAVTTLHARAVFSPSEMEFSFSETSPSVSGDSCEGSIGVDACIGFADQTGATIYLSYTTPDGTTTGETNCFISPDDCVPDALTTDTLAPADNLTSGSPSFRKAN